MRVASIRFALILPILIFQLTATAQDQTFIFEEGIDTYNGTNDNTIYEDRADNSNGAHEFIYSGMTMTAFRRRALISFDLSSIAQGHQVLSAELLLHVDRSRPGLTTYTLHRLNSNWGEGTVNSGEPGGLGAPAQNDDATWNSNLHNQSTWTTTGGDFSNTPSATSIVGDDGTTATWTSAGLAADVQEMIDNPSTNFGWILLGVESGAWNAHRFVSAEGTTSKHPRLTIVVNEPITNVANWTLWE